MKYDSLYKLNPYNCTGVNGLAYLDLSTIKQKAEIPDFI